MTCDFLQELFGVAPVSEEEVSAIREQAKIKHDAEVAGIAAARAERASLLKTQPCPKCMGEGRIAQFSHRKGGECFQCGGSGIFTKYAV